MKRWIIGGAILFACAVVLLTAMLMRHRQAEREASRRREAAYSLALQHYSEAVAPGMIRKDVESYLQQNGIEFGTICCVDRSDTYADTVLIGKDPPPEWCGCANEYIAFQFTGIGASTDPKDKLHRISIFRLPVDCL